MYSPAGGTRTVQPLSRHLHVVVVPGGRALAPGFLDNIVDAEAVREGLLLLGAAVCLRRLAPGRMLAAGGMRAAVNVAVGEPARQLRAGLGGLLLDLLVRHGLGDGVVQELQVVLVGDGGGLCFTWVSQSDVTLRYVYEGGMAGAWSLQRSLYWMFLRGFLSSLAMLWPCSARYWMKSSYDVI